MTSPPEADAVSDRTAPSAPDGQLAPFLAGLAVFAVAAVLGWWKLPYGFGFHDEGMYMADAWRLVAGDTLFPDSAPSVVHLYVVFNALIFKLVPDITLLGFRQLQFVLTLGALATFGLAVYRWTGRYWFLPYALSVFAFTGLEVRGTAASLSYRTYPHLFFTLYLACFLFALRAERVWVRRGWLLASGVFLWAIGFSMLPLVVGMVAPAIYWVLVRWLRVESPPFSGRDLLFVLGPVALLWLGVLALYRGPFIDAVLVMWTYLTEQEPASRLDPTAWGYVAGSGVFLLASLYVVRLRRRWAVVGMAAGCALMTAVVGTNLAGALPPYRVWFSRPMWLVGALVALLAVFLVRVVGERWRSGACGSEHALPLAILAPVAVLAVPFSQASTSRVQAVVYLAIPAAVALAVFLVARIPRERSHPGGAAVLLALFLGPFYAWTAWADWRCTYFDLPPEHLTRTIPTGFARGVRTNEMFAGMVAWVERRGAEYSRDGDLAVFMDRVPMGYMLVRRRPALNHSWSGFAESAGLRADAVADMVRRGRDPVVAFRFARMPVFLPVPGRPGKFTPAALATHDRSDPLFAYILDHMRLVDRLTVNGEVWVECYVARAALGDPPPETAPGPS